MTHARIVVHVLRWLVAALTLLAAAEVATGVEVRGRVVDPEDRPVRGARVYAVHDTLDEKTVTSRPLMVERMALPPARMRGWRSIPARMSSPSTASAQASVARERYAGRLGMEGTTV